MSWSFLAVIDQNSFGLVVPENIFLFLFPGIFFSQEHNLNLSPRQEEEQQQQQKASFRTFALGVAHGQEGKQNYEKIVSYFSLKRMSIFLK